LLSTVFLTLTLKQSVYGAPLVLTFDSMMYLSLEMKCKVCVYSDFANLGMNGTPEAETGTIEHTFLSIAVGVFSLILL